MKKFLLILTTILSLNFYAQTEQSYYASALSNMRAQNFQAAANDFTQVIQLNPKNWHAYYNRAICENRLYQYKAAIDDFDKVLELDPKNAWASKNSDLSRRYLARAGGTPQDFNSFPNDAAIYAKSALTKQKLDDYNGAIQDYTQAIELHPIAGYYFGRADAYYNLKMFTDAIADFTKAINLDSKYAKAYLNRGSANYSVGNKTDACADWQQALKLGISQASDALSKYCK